ncbi:MAG: serine hydrolase domain-containing protein [Chloroflexota bacterium]
MEFIKISRLRSSLPIVLILIYALLSACTRQQGEIDSYLGFNLPVETIDSHIQQRMDELNIPGLSISIINRGEVVYQNTFGYANVADVLPVTDQTIFEGASISKSVFAFFAMTFVEDGKLDLDKPLYQYYPHPDITDDPRVEQITARMVLSNRSGFPNWREDEADGSLKIKFEPGTDYLYSGEGFQYLAMVLREIEQTDWAGLETIFQERVAQPLGLEHTVFIQTPYTRQHKAEPYDKRGQWIDWEDSYTFLKEDGNFYAPSSIHSGPQDFSRWMIALMNEELLTQESYEELFKPHASIPSDDVDASYTLGFFTLHIPFTELYGHSGDNVGFDSWFAVDTKRDWGFVMFANSDNGEAFGEELFFYLLTGPNITKLFVIIGVAALTVILLLFFGIRTIVSKVRSY